MKQRETPTTRFQYKICEKIFEGDFHSDFWFRVAGRRLILSTEEEAEFSSVSSRKSVRVTTRFNVQVSDLSPGGRVSGLREVSEAVLLVGTFS